MRARYFTAPDLAQAIEAACVYFGAQEQSLILEPLQRGSDTDSVTLRAIDPEGENSLQNMSAFYQFFYEADSVYLELYPHRGTGDPIEREELLYTLKRKNLSGLVGQNVGALLERGAGRVAIAPPQKQEILNEEAMVSTSKDEMKATILFLPREEGGSLLDLNGVRNAIAKAGVVYGIDEDALQKATQDRRFRVEYVIAEGRPPVNGEDGSLDFQFSQENIGSYIEKDDNGKIDYRERFLFVPVVEGQLLLKRIPATEGIPGETVTGKPLKQRAGREVRMPRSLNTYFSEDQLSMFAKSSGMVEYVNGVITVSNLFRVEKDVDMGVGNIDFDGSVEVKGNVISGMRIKATHGIVIGGVVEGRCEITAGGNIEVKRGIHGMDSGTVTAGGSVTAQFIERAVITAGGDVTSDVIVHSTIEANGTIRVLGKRGSLFGGVVRAGKDIIANTIGSDSYPRTMVEVGFGVSKRARYDALEAEIGRIEEEHGKLVTVRSFLSRSNVDPARASMLPSVIDSIIRNEQLLEEYKTELEALKVELAVLTNGKVHVLTEAFPGVAIQIGNAVYRVEQSIPYATFKFSDGDVVFTACELRR